MQGSVARNFLISLAKIEKISGKPVFVPRFGGPNLDGNAALLVSVRCRGKNPVMMVPVLQQVIGQ